MEIRDLETLGPLVASSLRSDATAQGPRVSKSRISMDSLYNLYIFAPTMKCAYIHAYTQVLTKYGGMKMGACVATLMKLMGTSAPTTFASSNISAEYFIDSNREEQQGVRNQQPLKHS